VTTSTLPLDVDGPAAPPRANGELVFVEPWEGRAFGLTMALAERGVLDYAAFRAVLIVQIAAWESDHPVGERFSYYVCWLQALEQVLASHGLVPAAQVAARSTAFAARPAGHDHGHEHSHDPDH
jgi:nitrile hydratase accessory protein